MSRSTGQLNPYRKNRAMEKDPDFYYRDEGSIVLLIPQNETARAWTREKLQDTPRQDPGYIAIEPRYFEPILEGIDTGGMVIKRLENTQPRTILQVKQLKNKEYAYYF